MNTINNSVLPFSRKSALVIEQLPNETLVYDLQGKKAHCLNHFATLVWQNCDGQRTVNEVCDLIASELSAPVRPEGVLLALEQLDAAKLLESAPSEKLGADRRKMLRVAGIALAVGAVATIVAPTPARAGSMLGSGSAATDGSQCATGIVSNGQCIGG